MASQQPAPNAPQEDGTNNSEKVNSDSGTGGGQNNTETSQAPSESSNSNDTASLSSLFKSATLEEAKDLGYDKLSKP